MRPLRWTLMAAGAALWVGTAIGTAFAHGGASVAVSPTAVSAGDAVQVQIGGYQASILVSITLEGVSGSIPLGTGTTDSEGAVTTKVTIPADLPPGTYSVKAVGGDDNEMTDLSVKAAGVAQQTPGSRQAETGAARNFTYKQPTAQWVGIAVTAVIVGFAGWALVMRRD